MNGMVVCRAVNAYVGGGRSVWWPPGLLFTPRHHWGVPPLKDWAKFSSGPSANQKPAVQSTFVLVRAWKCAPTAVSNCSVRLTSESRTGMQEKGDDFRGGSRSGSIGGWRSLLKRLGAVTVGDKCHWSWHVPSGRQRLGIGIGGNGGGMGFPCIPAAALPFFFGSFFGVI